MYRLEWRVLKSFLDFIREYYPVEEIAFIEHIFPKKMDVHFERIIRIIPPEAYPISEKAASEILIELAQICRNHRRLDTRLTAGLCPFHEDRKHGSFKVNITTGAFRCWSCGTSGGDIIAFVQKRDGLEFIDCLRKLCNEWGLVC